MIKIINVYDSKETDFNFNGLTIFQDNFPGLICTVNERLNGIYELTLECDRENPKIKHFKKYNIIKAPTPTGDQLFRIYKIIKNTNKIICCAYHIFYDLVNNFLEDVRPTELTGSATIKYILDNTQYEHNFKCFSDLTNKSTAYYIRKNPVQAILGGDKNSFLNRWGGELLRDNFNIHINKNIGLDRGVTIAYGKNLLGLEENEDSSNIVTRIMPTGLTEKNSLVILPEKYVDSPLINNYPFPIVKEVHFKDIKIDPGKLDLEGAYKALRKKSLDFFNKEKIDQEQKSYKVNFILLKQINRNKDFEDLQKVLLGDIVTVRHEKLNIDIKQKVIGYKYDSINKKYISIDLGSFNKSLSENFRDFQDSINDIKEDLKQNKNELITVLEKTNNDIKAVVERVNKNKTSIEVAEKRITSSVDDKISKCNSKIIQTEKDITSSVYDKIKDCNSKITQNAKNISLVVDGGEVDGRALVSAINMSNRKIDMKALNIDLDGYVTFSNLENGETTIDGSSIKAGTIDADEIGSRITAVSKFIHFNGHNGLGGIGLNRDNDLWLYSNGDVIIDARRMKFDNGDRVATREWVLEQLENIKK
ncbi:phage tail spike protein [Clostridium novyi]|uniref:phage tail spike protein n=1 Tax=Clostridium novyi TaxID=1542 RepID=UPI000A3FC76B|nr:phage tail spike protein [Clostridium novyi]